MSNEQEQQRQRFGIGILLVAAVAKLLVVLGAIAEAKDLEAPVKLKWFLLVQAIEVGAIAYLWWWSGAATFG